MTGESTASHYCCVPECESSSKYSITEISFHQFPKAHKEKVIVETEFGRVLVDRRVAWIMNTCIDKPVTDCMKVCSLHFTHDDYFLYRKGEYIMRGKKLKKNAIPSRNLPKHNPRKVMVKGIVSDSRSSSGA